MSWNLNGGLKTSLKRPFVLDDEEDEDERCTYCNRSLKEKRMAFYPQYCSKKCRHLWRTHSSMTAVCYSPPACLRFTGGDYCGLEDEEETDCEKNESHSLGEENQRNAKKYKRRRARHNEGKEDDEEGDEGNNSGGYDEKGIEGDDEYESDEKKEDNATNDGQAEGTSEEATNENCPAESAAGPSTSKNVDMLRVQDLSTWSKEEVASWATAVTTSPEIGEQFEQEDVDGIALSLIGNCEEGVVQFFTHHMNLKFGPALKLGKAVCDLIGQKFQL